MAYQNAMDAFNLKMPGKVPRTEYSASFHWPLIRAVTGIDVSESDGADQKRRAAAAFEKAWDYGFTWSVLTVASELTGPRTRMGHAVYMEGGSDFDDNIISPFMDESDVFAYDPVAANGARDIGALTRAFDLHYEKNMEDHPDQVNMTGVYITMISGLLEIFGWDMLLRALGEDPDAFGTVANRYADWILTYFEALAASKTPIVMIHDDIVWTDGPFASPAWFRKYIFPNYEKLFAPLKAAGKKILFTSDGTYDAFIDDIAHCGVNGFVMEPTTDMELIARKYGKTHSFVGNADVRALTFGDKDDIRAEVERCMRIGKDCPGFFMAVGNHIPPNVPVENALFYNDAYERMAYR